MPRNLLSFFYFTKAIGVKHEGYYVAVNASEGTGTSGNNSSDVNTAASTGNEG